MSTPAYIKTFLENNTDTDAGKEKQPFWECLPLHPLHCTEEGSLQYTNLRVKGNRKVLHGSFRVL